jgi:hypothetical protein
MPLTPPTVNGLIDLLNAATMARLTGTRVEVWWGTVVLTAGGEVEAGAETVVLEPELHPITGARIHAMNVNVEVIALTCNSVSDEW